MPVDAEDRDATTNVANGTRYQAVTNKRLMAMGLVEEFDKTYSLIQLCNEAGIKPNIPNDRNVKPTALSVEFDKAEAVIQDTLGKVSNERSLFEYTAEELINRIVKESNYKQYLAICGVSTFTVTILVPQDSNIKNFELLDGTKVNVVETDLVDECKITFDAAGEVIKGVNTLGFCTTLNKVKPVFKATRTDVDDASVDVLTTIPDYEFFVTMPIVGKIVFK
jgi:hypothetical protein